MAVRIGRLCLLLLALGASAAPLRAQEREVKRISFEGATSFEAEVLRAAIVSSASACSFFVMCTHAYLDPAVLRGDLVRLRLFYYQRGYRDATVTLDTVPHDEGVEVRVYHPLTLRHPSWLFRRMHEKVVVVDGERYIAGGRNLAEAYFGMARRKNFVDRDVYVEGPSAADADLHFQKLWSSKHVAQLKVHVTNAEKQRAEEVLDTILVELGCGGGFVELNTDNDWSEGQRAVDAVDFLHDPLDPSRGERVAYRLADIIERAKTSIVIESPYLVPPRPLLQLLEKKLAEGVYVQIVTNSLRSTDGVLPQAGYLKYKRRLLRAGIDIREYKGPDPLHAKSAVIDGRVVLIGSYNLDPRSQNLNTEVMCVVEDEELAQELLESIDLHLQNAWTIRGNGHPVRVARDPRVSRAKAFRAWFARLIVPLVENQL